MIRATLIRPAQQRDVGDIGRIHVESWRDAYQGILPQDYLDGLSAEKEAHSVMQALMDPKALYLIAEGDRGPLGYVSAGPVRGQDPIYGAELYEIYLRPEAQRHGLGRQLLDHMARRLHQAGFYTLLVWVLARNPNRRFYEKCGAIYLRTKAIAFAGLTLQANAYGWIDITLAMDADPV